VPFLEFGAPSERYVPPHCDSGLAQQRHVERFVEG
jgi:hypothetical protein